MTTDRILRVNELLRREIGEAIFRLMNEQSFDVAAITVTHVFASRDLQHARVLISIRGDPEQQRQRLNLIRRHRVEIQDQINRNLTLRYTPRLSFELDLSIEKGSRVLELLADLGPEDDNGATDTNEPPES